MIYSTHALTELPFTDALDNVHKNDNLSFSSIPTLMSRVIIVDNRPVLVEGYADHHPSPPRFKKAVSISWSRLLSYVLRRIKNKFSDFFFLLIDDFVHNDNLRKMKNCFYIQ